MIYIDETGNLKDGKKYPSMIKSRVYAFAERNIPRLRDSTTNLTNKVFITCLCNFRCILSLQKNNKQEKKILGIQYKRTSPYYLDTIDVL